MSPFRFHRLSALGTCVLASLLTTSCRRNDAACPVATIYVPAEDVGSLKVDLSSGTRVEGRQCDSEVVLPGEFVAVRRIIGGVNYLGLVADVNDDHIEVFSARHPSESGIVMVVIDTSVNLDLDVSFPEAQGSARRNVERARVQQGRHKLQFQREKTGRIRYWEEDGEEGEEVP